MTISYSCVSHPQQQTHKRAQIQVMRGLSNFLNSPKFQASKTLNIVLLGVQEISMEETIPMDPMLYGTPEAELSVTGSNDEGFVKSYFLFAFLLWRILGISLANLPYC